jgi:hypothetical protein
MYFSLFPQNANQQPISDDNGQLDYEEEGLHYGGYDLFNDFLNKSQNNFDSSERIENLELLRGDQSFAISSGEFGF